MIQGSEFFIILLVALVVIGPQRLPEMARKLGHWTTELRRTAADLRAGLEAEVADFQEISRELKAPLGDITTVAKDTADAANSVMKPVSKGGPQPQPMTQQPGDGEADVASETEPSPTSDAHPSAAADAEPDVASDAEPNVSSDVPPAVPSDGEPDVVADAVPDGGDLHGEPLAWTGPRPASGPTADDAMADLEEIERTGGALSDLPRPGPAPAEPDDQNPDDTDGDHAEHSDEAAPPQGRHEATG